MPAETRGARRARSNPNSEPELSTHEPLNEVLTPPSLEANKDKTLEDKVWVFDNIIEKNLDWDQAQDAFGKRFWSG